MKKPCMHIKGGTVLKGEVKASGSKNATLPILFSTILADGEYTIFNVPHLTDVTTALEVLKSIGFSYERKKEALIIKSSYLKNSHPSKELVQKMRASFLCLGPLLVRYKDVKIPLPGGCKIGERPVDLHLKSLEALGASIVCEQGWVHAKAPKGLKGTEITLDFPTVGGTENLILASVLAKGKTVIKNRACEPEVSDLINVLKKMGALIEETGEKELTICGVDKLIPFSNYKVMPDRIEAATFLLAGAITGGEIKVTHCCPEHLKSFLAKLEDCGFLCETQLDSITVTGTKLRKSTHIETGVYPKFPTDLQSQFLALMTQLEGESSLKENIFENRFRYVEELNKLKASVQIKNQNKAFVKGPVSLKGGMVKSTDLRASSGLILAALVAQGDTYVTDIFHLDRGHENFHIKLKSLGAQVERLD